VRVFNVGLFASDLPPDGGGAGFDASPALSRWLAESERLATTPVYVPPGRYRLEGDVEVPAAVTLHVMQGARFHIARGVTLQVAGTLEAPCSQIFSGEGAVKLEGRTREAHPEWWGASPQNQDNRAEIQAALDSGAGVVRILVGTFPVSGDIRLSKIGQSLVGDSMQESMIQAGAGFRGTRVVRVNGGPHQRIERLKIEANPDVDCILVEDSAALALRDVLARGGNAGIRYRRGNIQRWDNVYAESCVDGIVVEPSSDDTNGGTFIGVRAYGCANWGIDVRQGESPLGSSYNTWDASAESCGQGIRVRGGMYCQYTLYSENHRGDRFDVEGAHWFFLRNTDNDPTTPFSRGTAIGVHGTGTNLYFDKGWAPDRTGREALQADDTLGGNAVGIWEVSNPSGAPRNLTLGFLAVAPVGFRCTVTKRDKTHGMVLRPPAGMTLAGDTGVFGAFVENGCASLDVLKVSDTTAVLRQSYSANGTWQPALASVGGANPIGLAYQQRTGRYVKVGRMVYASFTIVLTRKGTGATGTPGIGGLPFESASVGNAAIVSFSDLSTRWTSLTVQSPAASVPVAPLAGIRSPAQSMAQLAWSDIADATTLSALLVYEATS
jgi:hypothetical protein